MCVFTTKRLLIVDVQGWSSKKVEYLTMPLKRMSGFSVKSGGNNMLHAYIHSAKVKVFNDIPGLDHFGQDLSRSDKNIWAVHTYLCKKLFHGPFLESNLTGEDGKGGYPGAA